MKYDIAEIMKAAHRYYRYVAKKQGKTFSDALKYEWKLEKSRLSIMCAIADMKARISARNDYFAANPVNETKVSYRFEGDVYNENSKGYLGSHYCGD